MPSPRVRRAVVPVQARPARESESVQLRRVTGVRQRGGEVRLVWRSPRNGVPEFRPYVYRGTKREAS